jgi:hypothetical protein
MAGLPHLRLLAISFFLQLKCLGLRFGSFNLARPVVHLSSHLAMLTIRAARAPDVIVLRTMIRELAEFERQLDQVTIEAEELMRNGFGADPKFRALIAE